MEQNNDRWFIGLTELLNRELVENEHLENFIHHFFVLLKNYFSIDGIAFHQKKSLRQPEYYFYTDGIILENSYESDHIEGSRFYLALIQPEVTTTTPPGNYLDGISPNFGKKFLLRESRLHDFATELMVATGKTGKNEGTFYFFSAKGFNESQCKLIAATATTTAQYLYNFLQHPVPAPPLSETSLRTVLNNAPIALFAIDQKGIVHTSEGGGLSCIGLKAGEAAGKSMFEYYQEHPQIIRNVERALKGELLHSTIQIGNYAYENRYVPVQDDDGGIGGVIVVSIDITKRTRIENTLKREKLLLNEILDALPINIFLKDEQGRFIFINKQTALSTGFDREHFIGQTAVEIFPDTLAARITCDDDMVRQTRQLIIKEVQHQWKGQQRDVLEGKTLVSLSGRKEGLLLGYQIDITEHKEAEHQVKLLRQWIDQSSEGIYVTDEEGYFVFVNKLAAVHIGHPVDELLGMKMQDIEVFFREEKNWREYVNELRTKKNLLLEGTNLTHEGLLLPVEVNAKYIEVGGKGYIVAFSRDISSRKQAEKELQEQKEFIHQVINTDPNLIYVKDYEGNFLLINQAVADHFDTTTEAFLLQRRDVVSYLDNDLQKRWNIDREVIEQRKSVSREEIIPRADGRICYFYTTKIPLERPDGKVHVLAISTDITEQKRIQRELIEAREQAERAKAAEDLFLANMSHEVRTPINGIIGFINLLLSSPLTAQQKTYLKSIKTSADNLKVIINDILDFTKMEFGKLVFEKTGFYVEEQVRTVVSSFEMETREKNIILECKVDKSLHGVIVIGDPVRLNQILINLLSNAVKFTMTGKVTVSIEQLSAPPGAESSRVMPVRFTVADTGIGIPEDKLSTIFEHFTQADESITRKFGGTGLGLSICKQLVELQGGQICVQSKLDLGTTFSFYLPYEIGSEQDLPDLEQKKIGLSTIRRLLKSRRILLVEDNTINQALVLNILQRWNVITEVAENGLVAIEKLKNHEFDLILMDVQMPQMDGFEATRYIRNLFKAPKNHTPIIALTANATLGYEDQCLKAGMNDYISKPFMQETLLNKILKTLNIHKTTTREKIKATETATAPVQSPDRQTLIDLTYLKEFSNNDRNFIMEMISIFIEACKQELPLVLDAAQNQRWGDVKLLVHKLKPSIMFMGIHKIKQEVQVCEDLAEKRKDPERIASLAHLIYSTCQQAVEELEGMISSGKLS